MSKSHNGTTGKESTGTSKPKAESTRSKPSVWLPAGYEVVEPFEPASDAADETMRIKRASDNIEFYRLKPGVYLPLGYEPESHDMNDLEEGWPRVIVRSSAKQVRFIRLAGKTYLQGDATIRRSRPRLLEKPMRSPLGQIAGVLHPGDRGDS